MAPTANSLQVSRELPDPRGGLHGTGAVPAIAAATKSIKLSERRMEDFGTF
jgi:hypothetical protein